MHGSGSVCTPAAELSPFGSSRLETVFLKSSLELLELETSQ